MQWSKAFHDQQMRQYHKSTTIDQSDFWIHQQLTVEATAVTDITDLVTRSSARINILQ